MVPSRAAVFTVRSGEILKKAGSLEDYTRGFNDKDYDTTGNLSYYGYRYYDPVGLIWNRPDPLYTSLPDKNKPQPVEGKSVHLYRKQSDVVS